MSKLVGPRDDSGVEEGSSVSEIVGEGLGQLGVEVGSSVSEIVGEELGQLACGRTFELAGGHTYGCA